MREGTADECADAEEEGTRRESVPVGVLEDKRGGGGVGVEDTGGGGVEVADNEGGVGNRSGVGGRAYEKNLR